MRQRSFGGALLQYEKRDGIRQRSVTFVVCSWVVSGHAPRAQKNADPHQAAESSVEIFVRKIGLPHIDPCGSRHLAVSNGRLPDSVFRITPDA